MICMVFVSMDNAGRILLPKKIREQVGADTFDVVVGDEEIVLRRVKSIEEMRGSMPFLKLEDWKREHDKER